MEKKIEIVKMYRYGNALYDSPEDIRLAKLSEWLQVNFKPLGIIKLDYSCCKSIAEFLRDNVKTLNGILEEKIEVL